MENTATQKQELESPEVRFSQNTSRSLIENIPMGILITDQDGYCIVINSAMSLLTGYSEAELLSMHSSAVIFYGNDGISAAFLRQLAESEDSPAELKGIHKNGTTSPWLVDAMKLTANRYMYFIRANSGRKSALATGCQNESWYKSLFENGHAVMMLIQPTTGEIIEANSSACKYYGWSQSQLVGKNIAEINCLTPEEIKSEMQLALKNNKKLFNFKHRMANGEIRDVEVYSGPVNISGVNLLYSLVHDITARKAAEEEVKEKEVQYRNLANSGLALIWVAGSDKLCTYFNEPWLKFTGRKLEEAIGNEWTSDVHQDDIALRTEAFNRAWNNQEPFEIKYRLKEFTGEYKWLLDKGSPNYNGQGEFIGFIGHCFDISRLKQAENELTKKSQMLEKQNKNFISREQKMIDLKMEINELLKKLGSIEKYRIPNRTDYDVIDAAAGAHFR